ncbi:MAG: hypothetical protein RLZZ611_793 [Cyanobacteriota bacterium]|jgi:hypothetical protein
MASPRPFQAALLLLPGLVALAGRFSLAAPPAPAPQISLRQPIEQADQRLRAQGWQPDGDPALESLDRELSGNSLTALRSCSGTGAGFCRYDYRRGSQQLEVITVPSADGDGLVHHWQLRSAAPAAPGP